MRHQLTATVQPQQLAALKLAAKIQFASSKDVAGKPMVFHSLVSLEAHLEATASRLGLFGRSLDKLTRAEAEVQLAKVQPEEARQAALRGSRSAMTPAYFERLALEMFLNEVKPALRFGHEPLAAEEMWAKQHEARLARSRSAELYQPYVFVAMPRAGSS